MNRQQLINLPRIHRQQLVDRQADAFAELLEPDPVPVPVDNAAFDGSTVDEPRGGSSDFFKSASSVEYS